MSILGAIFDSLGSGKRIYFTAYRVPYDAVVYLESLGVKAKPGANPTRNADGSVDCTIVVTEEQYFYAAVLLTGLDDVVVTEPIVKAIRPKTKWTKEGVKAKGPISGLLRWLSVVGG